jgi:DNA repair protein RadC
MNYFMKRENNIFIKNAADVYALTRSYHNRRQEHFLVITLSTNDKLLRVHHVGQGIVDNVMINSREIFYPAIRDAAKAIIVCHNHPDGECIPSNADLTSARYLQMAGDVLQIRVKDDIILSKGKYFSFKEDGPLEYRMGNQYGHGLCDLEKYFNGGVKA